MSETDWKTAERIRTILSDPKAPRRVKDALVDLTYNLYAETNAFSEPGPDECAGDFINGTAALLVQPDPNTDTNNARATYDEIVKLAERHEPAEYKLAHRCAEIYNEWLKRRGGRKYPDGAHYFSEHVDAVLEGRDDGLQPGINSAYFAPIFAERVRAVGLEDRRVVELLDLIRVVDDGEDLNLMYDESKRRESEERAKDRAAELAKPEPQDKTSDEWRYWKLLRLEVAFQGDDAEAFKAAELEHAALVGELLAELRPGHTEAARAILADLISERQRNQRARR